jgi:hypothetical protein
MSRENVELSHRAAEAFNRRDLGAFLALHDDDVPIEILEMSDPGDATVAAVRLRGHGAGGAVPVDTTMWRVTRWRAQKCFWWGSFRTESDVLAALEAAE